MVQIRDDNYVETGGYTIGLESLKPASPGAGALVRGGIVSGTIGDAIQKDQWTFSGLKGDVIELMSTSTALDSGFAAYTDVYAPSGAHVTGFWAGGNVRLVLPESGTYVVQIRDDNYTQTGFYTIGLEGLRPASPDAVSLAPNATVSGTIGDAIQKDQWLVAVPAGKRLQVTLSGDAIEAGYHVFADVFAPSGASLGGTWAGTATFNTSSAGTYLIQIRDDNYADQGTYQLRVSFV
jgi:hypothetical protein